MLPSDGDVPRSSTRAATGDADGVNGGGGGWGWGGGNVATRQEDSAFRRSAEGKRVEWTRHAASAALPFLTAMPSLSVAGSTGYAGARGAGGWCVGDKHRTPPTRPTAVAAAAKVAATAAAVAASWRRSAPKHRFPSAPARRRRTWPPRLASPWMAHHPARRCVVGRQRQGRRQGGERWR